MKKLKGRDKIKKAKGQTKGTRSKKLKGQDEKAKGTS